MIHWRSRYSILPALALAGVLAAGPLRAEEAAPRPLEVLRAEIDRVDQDLLRLLNERAGIVAEVGRGKTSANAAVFRPGRQASLIRKLAAPAGLQPPATLAQVWTAIIAGSILQQKPNFTVAVADAGDVGTALLAQDYFGAQPALTRLASADDALNAVSTGRADVAVIGLQGTWWQRLPAGMNVVAAAPFLAADASAAPQALIVARQATDPSGNDRAVVLLPANAPLPAGAQMLAEAGSTRLVSLASGTPPAGVSIGLYASPLPVRRAP